VQKAGGKPAMIGLLRLEAGEFDHLSPLLGFLGDKLGEVGDRPSGREISRMDVYGTSDMARAERVLRSDVNFDDCSASKEQANGAASKNRNEAR
jgi:hypothetical protein